MSGAAISLFGDSAAAERAPNLLYAAVTAVAVGALALAMDTGAVAALIAALVAASALTAFRVGDGRGGTRPEPLVAGGHGRRRGGARARHGHGGRRGADRGARRGERPDRISGRRVARPRRLPPRRQRARAPRRLARDSRTARSGEGGRLHSDAPRSRGRIHGEERARMAGAGDGAPHSHRV